MQCAVTAFVHATGGARYLCFLRPVGASAAQPRCVQYLRVSNVVCVVLLNVGLTRTRAPTATPEDDRGEKAWCYGRGSMFYICPPAHTIFSPLFDVNRCYIREDSTLSWLARL